VNGTAIDDPSLIAVLERLSDVETVTGITLTRFRVAHGSALLHFSDEGVDVAVIEVGMGGTWDSTNVIDSDVAVLTNVDLDHTAVLGTTIARSPVTKWESFAPTASPSSLRPTHRGRNRPTKGR